MIQTQPVAADAAKTDGFYARGALAVIVLFLAFRLGLSTQLPLIADEAYAVVVTRIPSLSYFDHPLLGFDFARLAAWLFGSEASFVVRLPHVLFGSMSAWLLFLVTRRAFGPAAGFWAVAWYSLAPFFLVSAGHFVVPDGPLNFFLLLALWRVLPDLLEDRRPDWRRWLLAGATLGLAALSKYTAALFGLGAAVLLLTSVRGRNILASPGPWAAGAIAMLCLAPIVIWNAKHGWVSFGFQSGRATDGGFNPLNFLAVQLGQAGFLMPWVWAVAIYLIARGLFWPRVAAERIFAVLAAIPVVLFDIIAMFGREILPHWSMPGFLFAFPLLGFWCASMTARHPKSIKGAFVASGVLVTALALAAVVQTRTAAITRALDLPERSDFDWTFLGWNALRDDFARRGIIGAEDAFIVPVTWLIGGKAGYALGPSVPIAEPLVDPRHFAFQHDSRLNNRADGYALSAAWPGDADAAETDLKRLAETRYRLSGESWRVAQQRGGKPSFVVIVQPVTPRID
ncbi:MAG: glycosyltransferase family 39 protein [Rhizobiaceae bacterium]